GSARAMGLCGGQRSMRSGVRSTLGLVRLLLRGLGHAQVGGDDAEHLLRVIAQRGDVHRITEGTTPREGFPFGENRLGVVADEIRKSRHGQLADSRIVRSSKSSSSS